MKLSAAHKDVRRSQRMTRNRRPTLRRSFLALIMLFAALASWQWTEALPEAQAAYSGNNGLIALTSDRDGAGYDIHVMNADGSGRVNITNTAAIFDQTPDWSPDGTKISFTTNRDGNFEVYEMNSDGTVPIRLTNDGAFESSPRYSPDGTKIAFETTRDGDSEIYIMNSDGSGIPVNFTSNPFTDTNAAWSPDGTQIAFTSNRHGNQEIYVAMADGSGSPTRLTNNPASDAGPAWSPDGTQIAFASTRFNANGDVFVMNADGTGQMALTNQSSLDGRPDWSPDGLQILFDSNRDDNNGDNFVMNADGSGTPVNLTPSSPSFEFGPDWQSQPTEVSLTSVKDSFLRSGKPNTNEGANPRLRVRASGNNRAVVGFDLTGIDTSLVTDARLVLTIAENANNWGQNDDRTVDVHPLLESFTEGNGMIAEVTPQSARTRGSGAGVTWKCATDDDIADQGPDCAQQWAGGNFGVATAPSILHVNGLTGPVEWDVTADVQGGADEWLVKKTLEGPSGKVKYYSREGASDAGDLVLAPTLILELTPVRIAFQSNRDGNDEIYSMSTDGTDQVRLTVNSWSDGFPSWSPDRSQLAFTCRPTGADQDICVMSTDGTNIVVLTTDSAEDWYPRFSPDASQFAFLSDRNGNREVFVMAADGTGQTNISNNGAEDDTPSWGANDRIAFSSRRDGGDLDVYTMDPDGANVVRATTNGDSDAFPAWSPDDSRIAFVRGSGNSTEVYTMDPDGTNEVRLTNNAISDTFPTWSPSGNKIAFTRGANLGSEIYTMNSDGTSLVQLTNNAFSDNVAAWFR